MPDIFFERAAKGAETVVNAAHETARKMLSKKKGDTAVGFPNTSYSLPLSCAFLGKRVKDIHDCLEVIQEAEFLLNRKKASNGFYIETSDGRLNAGVAALLCEEILAVFKYLNGEYPVFGYTGFLADNTLRSLGIKLVDGRISGIALIEGSAPNAETAIRLIRDFQNKNIVCLLAGSSNDISLKEQLESGNTELGINDYIVPLGDDHSCVIYALNWMVRVAFIYGGLKCGQWKEILRYTKMKVPAFLVALGEIDEIISSSAAGALAMGFPLVTVEHLSRLKKIETTLYDAIIAERDYCRIADRCIEARGLKISVPYVGIPVSYAASFEGERVGQQQLYAEFCGRNKMSFECLRMRELKDIEDQKVELIGPDIDELPENELTLPLCFMVEVAGRKMQRDFEPFLENQIHRFLNYARGVMHAGSRKMNCIKISREAFDNGFRLKHLGVIIHAMLHKEYATVVDKVQVKIYTREHKVEKLLQETEEIYSQRDERQKGMSDEAVDVFYSCTLCQSIAPNHVCIITPERVGLCGAYSWLDAKASSQINPTGPNQAVAKGDVIDLEHGQFSGINEFVFKHSDNRVDKLNLYSIMNFPQSSCGCFECIAAIVPEANGVMVVDRDYPGMTPTGMNFAELAGLMGAGLQIPGFLGIAKLYVMSKKFISAEGGISRVVWMSKRLKKELEQKLTQRFKEIGLPDLFDKIADETVAENIEGLLNFLKKVKHPVLEMKALL